MESCLYPMDMSAIDHQSTVAALESGQVLFFPDHCFKEINPALLSDSLLDGTHKNISFDFKKDRLGGCKSDSPLNQDLKLFMTAFARFAEQLIADTLPAYSDKMRWGRTSFRPAQISGRAISRRKDDTRLHVDAFPATPVSGQRILRVFCNINPHTEPRVWHIGEPFAHVLARFAPQIPPYHAFKAHVLKWIKATKSLRSAYDHYMLHLHDSMKLDDHYQATVQKQKVDFPAMSTWIVYTDHVSHAALSGQYLLEQTFYLPVDAMSHPEHAPLSQWEQLKQEKLHTSVV